MNSNETPCGSIEKHEPHDWSFFASFRCPGQPEEDFTVIATGVADWTFLRDKTVPALQRDFPGAIVEADQRVVYSTDYPRTWKGASLTVLGMEYRTAVSLSNAIQVQFGYAADVDLVRPVTADEKARLREHRGR